MHRTLSYVGRFWPVIISIFVLTFTTGQAETTLTNHERRITTLETIPNRLDHIDAELSAIHQYQLDHDVKNHIH